MQTHVLASGPQCHQQLRLVQASDRKALHHRTCFTSHRLVGNRGSPWVRVWTRPSSRSAGTVQADSTDDSEARQEALLERRERAARRKKDSSSYRQLQAKQQANRQAAATGKPRWPEGQLFPDGWEEMGVFGKAWQLYAGDRGLLFWANKLAFGAIFAIIGGWILFRFVGPATGLYQLTNDISTPSKF